MKSITCNYCPNVGNVQASRVKSRAHSKEYKVVCQETSMAERPSGTGNEGKLGGDRGGVVRQGICSACRRDEGGSAGLVGKGIYIVSVMGVDERVVEGLG